MSVTYFRVLLLIPRMISAGTLLRLDRNGSNSLRDNPGLQVSRSGVGLSALNALMTSRGPSNTGNFMILVNLHMIKRDVCMSKMANLSHEEQNGNRDSPYSDLVKSNCLLQNGIQGGVAFV